MSTLSTENSPVLTFVLTLQNLRKQLTQKLVYTVNTKYPNLMILIYTVLKAYKRPRISRYTRIEKVEAFLCFCVDKTLKRLQE